MDTNKTELILSMIKELSTEERQVLLEKASILNIILSQPVFEEELLKLFEKIMVLTRSNKIHWEKYIGRSGRGSWRYNFRYSTTFDGMIVRLIDDHESDCGPHKERRLKQLQISFIGSSILHSLTVERIGFKNHNRKISNVYKKLFALAERQHLEKQGV